MRRRRPSFALVIALALSLAAAWQSARQDRQASKRLKRPPPVDQSLVIGDLPPVPDGEGEGEGNRTGKSSFSGTGTPPHLTLENEVLVHRRIHPPEIPAERKATRSLSLPSRVD